MQAGRLLDIKPFGMNAVPLVLGHHNAQPTMFYVHLRSTALNHLCIALSGDSRRSEPHLGSAALMCRATRARGDRERQAIGSGPPGTIATACQPSACRSSTNVE